LDASSALPRETPAIFCTLDALSVFCIDLGCVSRKRITVALPTKVESPLRNELVRQNAARRFELHVDAEFAVAAHKDRLYEPR
jgi:hypothetical protein